MTMSSGSSSENAASNLCIFFIHPYVWMLTICGIVLTVLYTETNIFAGGALAAFVLLWALIVVVLVKILYDICYSHGQSKNRSGSPLDQEAVRFIEPEAT